MRFTTAFTIACASLLAALAMAVGVEVSGASAATTSAVPTWSAAQTYSSVTNLLSAPSARFELPMSVACPSYGNCVAVGTAVSAVPTLSLNGVVMVETANGQWGQPISAPLPTGGDSLDLTSVACSSATSCVAVGWDEDASSDIQAVAIPFTVSGSSVSFGTPKQVPLPTAESSPSDAFLSGVSCNAGGCAAVGTYQNSSGVWTAIVATPGAGGSWTATAVAPPVDATGDNVLTAISCPSSGACEAAGNSADGSGNLLSWTVAVTGGTAGTAQPVAGSTGTASVPTGISTLLDALGDNNPSLGLTSISCPVAGACTAVGTFASSPSEPEGVAVPITQGAPGQFSTLDAGGASAFGSVSCSDASDCVAVGERVTATIGTAVSTAEANGSWSAPIAFQGDGGGQSASAADSIACPSAGVCVAAGFDLSLAPSGTTTDESFFAYSAPPPTITTSSLPAATVGQPYSATLESSGSVGSSDWSVTTGSLPAGLTLDAATGVISGTPTASGQMGFIVTVTSAGPPSLSGSGGLSITVAAAPAPAAAAPAAAAPAAAAAQPVASVRTAYALVSGNTATVVLSCWGARCAGAFKLTAVEHLRGKTPTAVVARGKTRATKRTITLANGHYSVNANATTVIKVKLNGKGARLLHQLGKISGRLTLTPTGAKKPALIKTLTFKHQGG